MATEDEIIQKLKDKDTIINNNFDFLRTEINALRQMIEKGGGGLDAGGGGGRH